MMRRAVEYARADPSATIAAPPTKKTLASERWTVLYVSFASRVARGSIAPTGADVL
jgi:hypothetical protein